VNVIEATKVNIHAAVLKVASGQLRFLGSNVNLRGTGANLDGRRM